jgi:hypothetical protein
MALTILVAKNRLTLQKTTKILKSNNFKDLLNQSKNYLISLKPNFHIPLI